MKKELVLVTGGTGFLGSTLLKHLIDNDFHVRAIKRPNSPTDLVRDFEKKVDWAEGDVTDIISLQTAMEGVSKVYHCAAMVSFHPKDVARMMKINVEGTANVVNVCLDFGVKKLLHVSSIAAIGRSKERPNLDEKSKWVESKLNSNYAISKHLSELEAWRGDAEGLTTAIVNPAIILGSGFWDLGSARFFKQVNDGLKFCPVGTSGFVDVRDVARFMVLLMESEISGERFILNAGNLPYRDFFQKVADAIDKKPPFIKVTPFLAEVAWRVEWLKEKLLGVQPMVTKESARASVSTFFYGNDKSRSVFNFEYSPLDDSIRAIGQQFLKARENGFQPAMLPF